MSLTTRVLLTVLRWWILFQLSWITSGHFLPNSVGPNLGTTPKGRWYCWLSYIMVTSQVLHRVIFSPVYMTSFWVSFGLLGPCQCLSKMVRLISDTAVPVSISISTHLSLMLANTIIGSILGGEMRKSLCTEEVSPEVIECVSWSWSSLSTLCV